MTKWAHSDTLDGGLTSIKTNATRMLLLTNYTAADSYATVTGNAIASVTMASGDYTLSTSGSNRVVTTASGKSATASGASQQYDNGTATGGSTTTLADTSKAWTVNAQAGRAVTILSGTGAGQVGHIASNTATVLTIGTAWTTAPDATSVYRISDDLHIAFTDGSAKVLWVTDETSNQAITSGNTVNFPQLAYTAQQPV
jgi:ferric-dicitrate binding protein FerR (iron transport regulator)